MGKNLYNMGYFITKLGHRTPILLRNAEDGVPYKKISMRCRGGVNPDPTDKDFDKIEFMALRGDTFVGNAVLSVPQRF